MRKRLKVILSKFLLSVIFGLSSLIFINMNNKNEDIYKKVFFDDTLSFVSIKGFYEKYLGSVVPEAKSVGLVSSNKDVYTKYEDYYDGVKFLVSDNTLVNALNGGIVVYKGDNDIYKECIIIQGNDGYYYTYGNIINSDLKLYDYIEKNTILGEALGNEFYLVIKHDDKYVKYEDYKV